MIISTTTKNTTTTMTPILDHVLYIRKQLQKVEFLSCWMIFFFVAAFSAPTAYNKNIDCPTLTYSTQFAEDETIRFITAFCRCTIFTRAIAYAVDFANAKDKLKGVLPMWLKLHHSGVFLQHFIKIFFLTPTSPQDMMMYLLATQSTHNTWTKKHSLVMYWGNVAFGVSLSVYALFVLHPQREEDCSIASIFFGFAMVLTGSGVALLVLENVLQSSSLKNYQIQMRRASKKVV